MKLLAQLILILAVAVLSSFAPLNTGDSPQQGKDIIGKYITEEKKSHIEIFKDANNTYSGKVLWALDSLDSSGNPKVDNQNPDKSLHHRKIKGLLILKNFTYDREEEEWTGGTIYDPKAGKTYTAYMWFEEGSNQKILKLKGYVMGITWLGKSTVWTRMVK